MDILQKFDRKGWLKTILVFYFNEGDISTTTIAESYQGIEREIKVALFVGENGGISLKIPDLGVEFFANYTNDDEEQGKIVFTITKCEQMKKTAVIKNGRVFVRF